MSRRIRLRLHGHHRRPDFIGGRELSDDGDLPLEAVFIAATVSEVDLAERLLEEEGIEYEVTVEAHTARSGETCLNGVLFQVHARQAEECRRLFESRGLAVINAFERE